MKAGDIPDKFPIPFANGAGGSYIHTIPVDPTGSNLASLTEGFPPVTMTPEGGGGIPPDGRDFNGILFDSTSWDRWFSAGGPLPWDSAFSTAIGGYPQGTVVAAASIGFFWISTADDNTSNPDTGGANWVGYTPIDLYGHDTGTANAGVVAPPAVPADQAHLEGVPIFVRKIGAANTGGYTLDAGFGPVSVVNVDGTALANSQLPASGIFCVQYDGTNFQLQTGSSGGGSGITAAQLQQQAGNYAADTGSANAMVITLSTVPANLAALVGAAIRIKKIGSANTGAVTLAVNGLPVTAVKYASGAAIPSGDLPANGLITVSYDGTQFVLQTKTAPSSGGQAIYNSGLLSWAAGSVIGPLSQSIGQAPIMIPYVECTNGSGSDTYAFQDRVLANINYSSGAGGSDDGVEVWMSNLQIGATIGQNGIKILPKSGGGGKIVLSPSNWKLRLIAVNFT